MNNLIKFTNTTLSRLWAVNSQRAPIYLSKSNLVSKQFEEAKDKITTLKEEPSNEIKLKIYALFKQATVGKCNVKKPGMTDFVARAKWNAWNQLTLSQEEAEKSYIDLVNDLVKADSKK